MIKLVLASKSKVRKEILNKNNINCTVEPSNVDEDSVKQSLLKEGAIGRVNHITFDLSSGDPLLQYI